MATWLPIRKYNRTQSVRIGTGANAQKVRATIKSGDADATSTNQGWLAPATYINIEDAAIRKQFTYHSAIGAVYVTGSEIHIDSGTVLSPGGRVDVTALALGNDTTSIATISVSPIALLSSSSLPVYSSNTNPATINVPVPGSGWTTTNITTVLVQFNTTTGAVSVKVANGAGSAPAAPSPDSNNVSIATFPVTRVGNTSANTAGTITNTKSNYLP
jgi:hypothetical protein